MSADAPSTYDDIPYPGVPFQSAHPDTLAAVASLFGLDAAPANACRVLELGCGIGGHLIPMAAVYPQSEFIGIDLSARQIETACETVAELGLTNIRFEAMDLADIDESFGSFDYILCHGVFSWVPEQVRSRILEVNREHLKPDGLAYISYNTYPGWYLRRAVREMLVYEAQRAKAPRDQVKQALQFLRLQAEAYADADDAFHAVLKEEAEHLNDRDEAYIYHEYLEADNNPMYFADFVRLVEQHDLEYVADTELDCIDCQRLDPRLHQALAESSSGIVDFEQRADFSRGRSFRRSILCRNDREPTRPIDPKRIQSLWLASCTRLKRRPTEIRPDTSLEFEMPNGRTLTTNNPLAQAMLAVLSESWPHRMAFDTLLQQVVERLEAAGISTPHEKVGEELAGVALQCFPSQFVSLYSTPITFPVTPSERPQASPVARLQARHGQQRVTNLLHLVVDLHPLQRVLLPWVDGTRTAADLTAVLVQATLDGQLDVQEDGQPVTDPERLHSLLEQTVQPSLAFFGQMALLVA